ncbi:hypothetical protein [Sphingomonas sp. KR3-1]|uniref:hypothetical protein n=1 Tax=Sphingomonas sp. KR3-1 TaxID=3156611 RepID=UPI0032B4ED64
MKIRSFALVGAAGLALAACSGSKTDDTQVNETIVANIGEPENLTNVTITEPTATPTMTNASAPPPVADLAPDAQTQDDADATGMTAKVDRNTSEGQPAQ